MKPAASYRLWLARRIEAGDDLQRVRDQIVVWGQKLPEGLNIADIEGLLAELDAAGPKPKAKTQRGRAPDPAAGAFG